MVSFLLSYLLMINLIAFFVRGWDKRQAMGGKWRIAEKHLLLLTGLGGFLGAIAGMQLFHHKTIKGAFLQWFWGIVVVWIIIVILLLYFGSGY